MSKLEEVIARALYAANPAGETRADGRRRKLDWYEGIKEFPNRKTQCFRDARAALKAIRDAGYIICSDGSSDIPEPARKEAP